MGKHKICAIFGREAVNIFDENGKINMLPQDGVVSFLEFETEGELKAFKKGLNLSQGWEDFTTLDENEYVVKGKFVEIVRHN